ncbi:MAG TPA: acetyl-CoA carboxylase biotin carboxylase subunit [Thermomicrobiales bacterium]|nr:acetyl-CoA carboxylase biotin carboxylase subunit [Thermomicrobiales bacterium]
MLRKVLVANRGEIALRVMRACREERIATVAVYAPGEEDARHVRYADEAVELAVPSGLPYINIDAVIGAAIDTGADGIHPGYGFLAESPEFARACRASGLIFVGPPAEAIEAMGDKVRARQTAERAGVPVVPGSREPVDVQRAIEFGKEVGFPIALKAVAGGGGRGFKVAWADDEVQDAWNQAAGEGERYFGNDAVYVEKYLEKPRHIEIQIMADQHGNVVALGERDCSIQRRHQKLIEEAPSPALDDEIRARMNETSERLAQAVGYVGAGTVEFLFSDGDFYFLEMNTRIQVEHPVTEEITGIDLVREQLRVAAGQQLSFDRAEIRGHAIECRINAEDPARDFAPSPGKLVCFSPPSGFGVRVDTGFAASDEIDPRFDNLIAKLIVRGRDRDEAISRLDRALRDFEVGGVPTTIELFRRVLRRPDFRAGDYDTRYLERTAIAGSLAPFEAPAAADDESDAITVEVNGRQYRVRLPESLAVGNGARANPAPARARRDASSAVATGGSGELKSPIQGTVIRVAVSEGDQVEAGDLICVVEAMKMENEMLAPRAGTVTSLNVEAGQTVRTGALLAVIE